MKVRLGYVAISCCLDINSSSPYTYTEYQKYKNLDKLDKVIISNLEGLNEIIKYNIKNNIHFYRISSKIIPLATKDDVEFDYIDKYKKYYNKIKDNLKKSNMRIDFHPDQFTVLNSTKQEVVKNSIKNLEYHYKLLEALKVKNKILVLHVGSSVFGKENSIKRFINNFNKLPKHLQEIIAIENDDKIFTIQDVTFISDKLHIPIILDYHHHICNKSTINYEKVFASWSNITPKIHFSSPKSKKEFRSHHEYINCDEFITFLENIKKYNQDIDIMIEAKAKDDALFRLVRQLKYKTNYKFIDETTFIV